MIYGVSALSSPWVLLPFSRNLYCSFTSKSTSTSGRHLTGTTTVAKKGGDRLGFSGHKHLKGDKVVLCDRNCNDRSLCGCSRHRKSPLLKKALPQVTRIAS